MRPAKLDWVSCTDAVMWQFIKQVNCWGFIYLISSLYAHSCRFSLFSKVTHCLITSCFVKMCYCAPWSVCYWSLESLQFLLNLLLQIHIAYFKGCSFAGLATSFFIIFFYQNWLLVNNNAFLPLMVVMMFALSWYASCNWFTLPIWSTKQLSLILSTDFVILSLSWVVVQQ